MANDVTWWKDRDKWMPGVGSEPAHQEPGEKEDLPGEDAGTSADDDSEELDDKDLPERADD